jgi:hypothetical protein
MPRTPVTVMRRSTVTSHRQTAYTLHTAHIWHATHSCRYQACNAKPTNDDAHLSLPDGVQLACNAHLALPHSIKLACNAHLACNVQPSLPMRGSPVTVFQPTPGSRIQRRQVGMQHSCHWHAHLAHTAHRTTQTCHTRDKSISTQRTRGIQCLRVTGNGNAHLTVNAHVMQRTPGMPRTPALQRTPSMQRSHGMRRTYDGGADRQCGGRRRS